MTIDDSVVSNKVKVLVTEKQKDADYVLELANSFVETAKKDSVTECILLWITPDGKIRCSRCISSLLKGVGILEYIKTTWVMNNEDES